MEYVVMQDYYSNEFDFELREGQIVDEADFAEEPDLVANLVNRHVLALPENYQVVAEDEPEAEAEPVEEEGDEETPKKRGR